MQTNNIKTTVIFLEIIIIKAVKDSKPGLIVNRAIVTKILSSSERLFSLLN